VVLEDVITDPSLGNALTDDSSNVLTIYKPDRTSVTPTVNRASLGTYTGQIVLDQTGWWEYVFSSTGAGAGAARGRFYVSLVP